MSIESINREKKAKALAAAFREGRMTPEQVRSMEPRHWKELTKQLKLARVLRPYAGVPSPATIEQVLKLLRPVCSHRGRA